jgi:starch phosphorylase
MKPLGRITVSTIIPERLSRLSDLAHNFWWTWNYEAVDLFKSIDSRLWYRLGANPVALLRKIGNKRLLQRMSNASFMESYDHVVKKFDEYMSSTDTWFNSNHPGHKGQMTAYFSAEFGLSESLPVYSGGLGVLSGDHCKSASDLGIPFTAIGLFYRQGYFNQLITREGIQETAYSTLNLSDLAISPVFNANGENLLIGVDMPGRTAYASIWLVKVGRVHLYLLDSDVPDNSEQDRRITARLYGGDGDTRIQQEILLGMGGVKALKALGINASIYHMNEGHSAFLGFELIRNLMQEQHLNFKEACEAVASSSVFTTHTPVPAGIDVFSHDTIDRYFTGYRDSLGISREEFLALGADMWNPNGFNMASLAMALAAKRNGVSKLHGVVTRRMFNSLWPDVPEDEVPVTHVTNGIHTLTWLSTPLKKLYDKYLAKGWDQTLYEQKTWEAMDNIPDEELWHVHLGLKTNMTQYINSRVKTGDSDTGIAAAEFAGLIDPGALTIGFSRRFATYKRASLIFRDIQRIRKLLNMKDMPVQLIFAGKAHPADRPAQDIIKSINDVARQEGFEGKVILLENYNMALARRLVQSVDVWLNNPRVPMEASGTSGQKACINGVLNLSVLDGWWKEGYNGKNGWAIGTDAAYENEFYQDNADSESLYEILEKSLVPLYYDRNEKGVPVKWVKMMKESVKSLAAEYSTHRMVQEYTDRLYIPSIKRISDIIAEGYEPVRRLAQWKQTIKDNWQHVSIAGRRPTTNSENLPAVSGEKISLEAVVTLGGLKPEDVSVELYFGIMDSTGRIERGEFVPMQFVEETNPGTYRSKADFVLMDGGEYGYNFRIIPGRKDLADKFELRLVKWADSCVN